ncbi:MAG TPA: ABC transporter permease [Candidatus Limnocylindrales bacterium]|jgi:ABC-2 type transport system permease protein|nr:ABC transporter permease [Candidatus Limnocylindrales bacterium]
MKYALLVAWREYAENAKTKGFWIGLFLMPTILFLSAQVPIWLEEKATPTRSYVLVDQAGSFEPVIELGLERSYQQKVLAALNDYARKYATAATGAAAGQLNSDPLSAFGEGNSGALDAFINKGGKAFFLTHLRPRLKSAAPEFKEPRRLFQRATLPVGINSQGDLAGIAETLKPYLRGEKKLRAGGEESELGAAILIPTGIEGEVVRPKDSRGPAAGALAGSVGIHQVQYWSVSASDFGLRSEIEQAVNGEIRRREYLARGIDGAVIGQVEATYIPFTSLNPKKEKGKEAVNIIDTIKQWAPSGFVYLLWLAIFVIIQMLLNNTIEEKSNRIIEVLLSSVTPGELMMGKLFGIAAIGLTMVGAWMLALFGILSWKVGGASEVAGQLLTVLKASNLVPLFSIYFLLGYLMYAAFILSVGSVCNTLKEAQSYMGVLTMIMMIPLLTMTFIPKDPNGSLARILSWIPLYTPFTMMNRATADPPLVDLIGTFVLLVATTVLALWMSGKIFRLGILRTGQPPKVIEMLRWALRRSS